jgi:hypothetical protein
MIDMAAPVTAVKGKRASVVLDGVRIVLAPAAAAEQRKGLGKVTGVGAALVESVKREVREQGKHVR